MADEKMQRSWYYAFLAQSVEHAAVNRRVVGSSPTEGAKRWALHPCKPDGNRPIAPVTRRKATPPNPMQCERVGTGNPTDLESRKTGGNEGSYSSWRRGEIANLVGRYNRCAGSSPALPAIKGARSKRTKAHLTCVRVKPQANREIVFWTLAREPVAGLLGSVQTLMLTVAKQPYRPCLSNLIVRLRLRAGNAVLLPDTHNRPKIKI